MRRRERAVEVATELLDNSLLGRRVTVLGAAFKPNSDDVRDSPALNVAAALQLRGAQVRVHDPVALDNASRLWPTLQCEEDLDTALAGTDLVLHLTEWQEYRDLDPGTVRQAARTANLLDARNALYLDQWRAAGWTTRALGRV